MTSLRSTLGGPADGSPDTGGTSAVGAASDRLAALERRLHAQFVNGLSGDAKAYAAFLQEIAGSLRTYFRRRLFGAGEEIEDLAQEVLIAVHTRRGVQVPLEEAGELFADSDLEAGVARRDRDRLLERLPPRQRDPIRLVKVDELSVREAAQRSSRSESDVKVSIHRGIRKLSEIIRGES